MVKVTDWWEADQEAIKDAEEALDEFNKEQEINDLEEEKENALDAIDEQIKGWEDYKDAWESVVENYEFEQDRLILLQKLGAETENEILQQKIDAINRYKDAYLSTMKEIKELELYKKNVERYFSYLRKDKLTKQQKEWKINFESENDLLWCMLDWELRLQVLLG